MPGSCALQQSHKSNTKFPFKSVYFLGVRGLTSPYIMYDNTTSGQMDLCVCVCVYIYIYTHIQSVTGGMCETSGECSLGQTILK